MFDPLNLEPQTYRAGKFQQQTFLLDGFRALLAFLYDLENIVAARRLNPEWNPANYMPGLLSAQDITAKI